jgi:hypothetical protein
MEWLCVQPHLTADAPSAAWCATDTFRCAIHYSGVGISQVNIGRHRYGRPPKRQDVAQEDRGKAGQHAERVAAVNPNVRACQSRKWTRAAQSRRSPSRHRWSPMNAT